MMLQKRQTYYQPAAFTPGTNLLHGASLRFDNFDRSYPWEEMYVIFNMFANATPPSTMTVDGAQAMARNINLSINDGKRPRSVVNGSGVFFLEYAAKKGLNLDAATLAVIAEHTKATPALTASTAYQLTYRIPLVDPLITEPLRTRMLLDVQNHVANPVLTIDVSTLAQMAGAGTLDLITCEVVVMGRDMPAGLNDQILKDGGYIPFDLLETPFSIPLSTAGEQRFDIPSPGWYSSLLLRQYLGGATVIRSDISNQSVLVAAGTNAGTETKWSLKQGQFTRLEWRQKHIRLLNDQGCVLNSQVQSSSPSPGQKVVTGLTYQSPSSILLDFLTDGLDNAAELGSLLDCNAPNNSSLKTTLICSDVKSVATNPSLLYIGGHRYYDDGGLVRKWQSLRAA